MGQFREQLSTNTLIKKRFQQTFPQTESAFDQDTSSPPQMDYTALEHSSLEMENSVTADKMVGTGCINKKQGHENNQK